MKKLLTQKGKPYYRLKTYENGTFINMFESPESLVIKECKKDKVTKKITPGETKFIISFKNRQITVYQVIGKSLRNGTNRNKLNIFLNKLYLPNQKQWYLRKAKISSINKIIYTKAKKLKFKVPKLDLTQFDTGSLITTLVYPQMYQEMIRNNRSYKVKGKYLRHFLAPSLTKCSRLESLDEAIKQVTGITEESSINLIKRFVANKGYVAVFKKLYTFRRMFLPRDLVSLLSQEFTLPESKKDIISLRKALRGYGKEELYHLLLTSNYTNLQNIGTTWASHKVELPKFNSLLELSKNSTVISMFYTGNFTLRGDY